MTCMSCSHHVDVLEPSCCLLGVPIYRIGQTNNHRKEKRTAKARTASHNNSRSSRRSRPRSGCECCDGGTCWIRLAGSEALDVLFEKKNERMEVADSRQVRLATVTRFIFSSALEAKQAMRRQGSEVDTPLLGFADARSPRSLDGIVCLSPVSNFQHPELQRTPTTLFFKCRQKIDPQKPQATSCSPYRCAHSKHWESLSLVPLSLPIAASPSSSACTTSCYLSAENWPFKIYRTFEKPYRSSVLTKRKVARRKVAEKKLRDGFHHKQRPTSKTRQSNPTKQSATSKPRCPSPPLR